MPNKPSTLFQPDVQNGLRSGINQIVSAIRPTLGPLPRLTAIQKESGHGLELLDCGGTIARRIIQIQDRDADMGAMLVRQMVWQLYEKVGDGTAAAAVIFQKIFNEGMRFLAAGGNQMLLRRSLEEGLQVILRQLEAMDQPLEGDEPLARIAETICHDSDLAKMLGEIFDIIGQYGQLDIQPGRGRELEREYIEGIYWDSGLLSRYFLQESNPLKVELENAQVLMTDLDIEDPQDLLPVLEQAVQGVSKNLLVIARQLSDPAIGYLQQVNHSGHGIRIVAVKVPFANQDEVQAALTDMTMLMGGQAITRVSQRMLSGITPDDFGRVRRAWANMERFGIVGGKGDARRLRQYIASLKTYYGRAAQSDEKGRLQKRIGKLISGSAILYIGGATEMETETRMELARRTARALRASLGGGLLPGGGVALLDCRRELKREDDGNEPLEKRVARQILSRALEEPFRAILSNAGLEPQDWLARLNLAGSGHGADVRSGRMVNMAEAGILDSTEVVKSALHSAVSTAALALTVDVFVHRRIVPVAAKP